MALELTRPLVFFDLETTGLDVSKDRIVEIAILREELDGTLIEFNKRVNPGIPIPPHVSMVHGITDEDVANAPKFDEIAERVLSIFEGADIAGYNSTRFDIPLLYEEFSRAGLDFNINDHALLDAQAIFLRHEPRTLSGAYAHYCGKKLINAHSALADARATREVLLAQVERYDDLPRDVKGLAAYCLETMPADLAGRLLYDVFGNVVFNFGKFKGRTVEDVLREEPGYVDWVLRGDFPLLTKELLVRLVTEFRGE